MTVDESVLTEKEQEELNKWINEKIQGNIRGEEFLEKLETLSGTVSSE